MTIKKTMNHVNLETEKEFKVLYRTDLWFPTKEEEERRASQTPSRFSSFSFLYPLPEFSRLAYRHNWNDKDIYISPIT